MLLPTKARSLKTVEERRQGFRISCADTVEASSSESSL
jgi:hypothetical protein